METNSSGEDLFIKTRKPYTITKQREKWTEEEHNKFIEALKLYGRAWQRIEEHIGTKTAVQIRSHAQKFFTKLEKEALMKGIPSGQDNEIEIPPPRPKRKPSGPYPRKTGSGSFYSRVESMDDKTSKSHCPPSACNRDTEMDDGAPTKAQGTGDNSEDGSRSEVLTHFKAAPSASVSSLNKGPSNTGAFKGFVPLVKGIRENIAKDSTSRDVSKDLKGSDIPNRSDDDEEVKEIQAGADVSEKPGKVGLPTLCQQEDQSFSNRVPMELPKENIENTNSGISSIYNPLPPFTPIPINHDAFSNFSSLVVSTLLQNPAVHAAATLAASFWPSAGTDISVDPTPQTSVGGIPDSHMNPSPSMSAIAAATVAAASAWWATQGLLQLFHPLHPAFAFAPAPTMDTVEVPRERKEDVEGGTLVEPEQSECGLKTDKSKPTANDGFHDPEKATSNKKLDRSSCGSNTPSSSEEVEIDALEKQNEDNDEDKHDQFNTIPSEDTNSKRARSIGGINESWKEVSQGGRIAFKALFTRGVLPQSFSPTHPRDPTINPDQDREAVIELPVDLNMKACESDTIGKGLVRSENLKFCRTGFKPYKRCSMEAKESRSGTGEESGNKRIRLEGETSVACNISSCFRTS